MRFVDPSRCAALVTVNSRIGELATRASLSVVKITQSTLLRLNRLLAVLRRRPALASAVRCLDIRVATWVSIYGAFAELLRIVGEHVVELRLHHSEASITDQWSEPTALSVIPRRLVIDYDDETDDLGGRAALRDWLSAPAVIGGIVYLDVGDSEVVRTLVPRLGAATALRSLRIRRDAATLVPLLDGTVRARLRRLYIGHSRLPDLSAFTALTHLSLDGVSLPYPSPREAQDGPDEMEERIRQLERGTYSASLRRRPPTPTRFPTDIESLWLCDVELEMGGEQVLSELMSALPRMLRLRHVEIVGAVEPARDPVRPDAWPEYTLPPPLVDQLAEVCAAGRITFVRNTVG